MRAKSIFLFCVTSFRFCFLLFSRSICKNSSIWRPRQLYCYHRGHRGWAQRNNIKYFFLKLNWSSKYFSERVSFRFLFVRIFLLPSTAIGSIMMKLILAKAYSKMRVWYRIDYYYWCQNEKIYVNDFHAITLEWMENTTHMPSDV